jgi:hypothetical protein
MGEEKENEGSSTKNNEFDLELALEAAREVSTEAFRRLGEIYGSSLTEEEQEQKIGEVIEEMNIQGNEIYQRKKQEGAN